MQQISCNFDIEKENVKKALEALKALDPAKDGAHGGSRHETWFSWVDTETYQNAETLHDAMIEWKWKIDTDEETGDVENIFFVGEKLGDDPILFNAIAPFVKKGSYIEMQGEEGDRWRWVFDGKKCHELSPEIKWPEVPVTSKEEK